VFNIVAAIVRRTIRCCSATRAKSPASVPIGVPLTFDLRPDAGRADRLHRSSAMRHWFEGLPRPSHRDADRHEPDCTPSTTPPSTVRPEDIRILQSPNMRLGVAVIKKLCADAAKMLGDDYDVEVMEAHHRFKKTPQRHRDALPKRS